MPATPLTDAINALTRYINGVTYLNDSTLSDAADNLVTFAKGNAPDVIWDTVWDPSVGTLSASGFTTTINGTATISETSSGVLMTSEVNSYAEIDFPTNTMTSGILEVDIVSNSSDESTHNFRFSASNGTNGVALTTPANYFKIMDGSTPQQGTEIIPCLTGGRYRIRLELGSSTSKVYVNNTLCKQVSNSTMRYTTINRIMQQNAGSTLVKAIRAKYS